MRKFTLKGAQILIGTPGRLLDIMQRSSCMCLKHLELVILDEADRLLDMGFRTQLDGILKLLPKQRRTGHARQLSCLDPSVLIAGVSCFPLAFLCFHKAASLVNLMLPATRVCPSRPLLDSLTVRA